MKRMIKAGVALTTIGLGVSMFGGAAHASAPPFFEPGIESGWDGLPDTVIGQGSDTTYDVMVNLTDLYNNAPGCQPYTGLTCGATENDTDGRYGSTDYDHDAATNAFPTGSSAGITGLLTPANYAQGIDYARSSRRPNAGETTARTFWGYGVDGITVVSFGTRTGVNLTQAQLNAIWHCQPTADDWSDFGFPAAPIVPWGMNSASGTASTFAGFVGFTADTAGVNALNGQACVRLLAGVDGITGNVDDVPPFENDVRPILLDPGAGKDGIAGNGDDDENNYLWWMSFGVFSSVPFKGSNPNATGLPVLPPARLAATNGLTPSGGSILAQSYVAGLTRLIWHVTKNGDADCRQAPGSAGACDNVGNQVYGAGGGKGGAVRELTEFLCNPLSSQFGDEDNAIKPANDRDPLTGRQYRTAIVETLNRNEFQQLNNGPVFTRTTGYACSVDTTT